MITNQNKRKEKDEKVKKEKDKMVTGQRQGQDRRDDDYSGVKVITK